MNYCRTEESLCLLEVEKNTGKRQTSTWISFLTCSLAFNIRTYFLRKRKFIVKLLTFVKVEIMFNVCDTYF